ncbi:MAG: hypothetical protein KGI97_00205, partial [Alphaproteobacteria bacterium]|nr:hypothetical protein [Alphaproteobacteria bacterium]
APWECEFRAKRRQGRRLSAIRCFIAVFSMVSALLLVYAGRSDRVLIADRRKGKAGPFPEASSGEPCFARGLA